MSLKVDGVWVIQVFVYPAVLKINFTEFVDITKSHFLPK